MPSIRGKPKEQISYKCPHDLLLKINTAIENGEYASRNDIITAALRTYFENRNNGLKYQITEWLISDEGKEYMINLIKRIQEKIE
jgi:metal-responsive CopG/Arc/MetJ family transcriptional regulator